MAALAALSKSPTLILNSNFFIHFFCSYFNDFLLFAGTDLPLQIILHTPETSAEGTCAFAPASGWSSAATRAPRFSVAAHVVGEFALRLCLFAPFHFILLLTPPSCLLLHRPLCGPRSLWMFSSVLSLRRQNSGEDLGCLLRRTCFLLPVLRCALLLMSFSPLFLSP